jgi:ribosomal protein S1
MRSLLAMPRFAPVVLALGLVLTPMAAYAGSKPPAPSASPQADQSAHEGGIIEGRVTNVDYNRGVISVDSTTEGKVDVSTMPTTSVTTGDPGYHTLTDVSKGSKVQIFISRTAGKLVAQIIHLLKH